MYYFALCECGPCVKAVHNAPPLRPMIITTCWSFTYYVSELWNNSQGLRCEGVGRNQLGMHGSNEGGWLWDIQQFDPRNVTERFGSSRLRHSDQHRWNNALTVNIQRRWSLICGNAEALFYTCDSWPGVMALKHHLKYIFLVNRL